MGVAWLSVLSIVLFINYIAALVRDGFLDSAFCSCRHLFSRRHGMTCRTIDGSHMETTPEESCAQHFFE